LRGTARVQYGEQLAPALIQPMIDAAARHALLRTTFPASQLIDASGS
jgi:hypothetical protein